MSFWEQPKPTPQVKPWEQQQSPIVLDEQVMAELQEDPEVSVFEEEEEDTAALMLDANLRLEQGRLYQMILQNDIFADTNADPRAIKNVQREIRKFVRERMETMLGIRQEQQVQQTIVSSPFNDMEVTALKMIASKVTKGASENSQQLAPQVQTPVSAPKKDGITSISGNLRQETKTFPQSVPAPKVATKPQARPVSKSNVKTEESNLKKSIDQMSQEELAAHDAAAFERRSKNYAVKPQNMAPHPTAQQLEMMYTGMAQNMAVKLVPPNM